MEATFTLLPYLPYLITHLWYLKVASEYPVDLLFTM